MSGLRLSRNLLGGAALIVTLSSMATMSVPGVAQGVGRGTAIDLGRNAGGDACTADRSWVDPAAGGFVKSQVVYAVQCTGTLTGDLARVRLFDSPRDRDAASSALNCGTPSALTLSGFTRASARRCYDPALGFSTVVIDAEKGGRALQISALPSAVGAGYQAALLVTGSSDGDVSSDRQPVNLASLAPLPSNLTPAAPSASAAVDTETVLARAVAANFRGRSADASRLLRSELSRLPVNTPGEQRSELLLEAGLAESNIRFFASATSYFDSAEAVINLLGTADQRRLRAKLTTYRGLHALNQREFARARSILKPQAEAERAQGKNALNDALEMARFNAAAAGKDDPRAAIAQPDIGAAREKAIAVQGNWALSVAELAQRNSGAAQEAITDARRQLDELKTSLTEQRVEESGLYWLQARLDRQLGRVQAERGQYDAAIKSFNTAIDLLKNAGGANASAGSDPAIAELKLELASIIERSGLPVDQADKAYAAALTALLESRQGSAGLSSSLFHPYLDRLAVRMGKGDRDAAAQYFAALQVAGESSAARQMNQLQNIVGEDDDVVSANRERQELTSRINDLANLIPQAEAAATTVEDRVRVGDLVAQRLKATERLAEVDAALASNNRLAQVSDRPAELAALQGTLKAGEGYVRLTVMGDRVFGVLIERDKAVPILPPGTTDQLLELATDLRRSVEFDEKRGGIPFFNVSAARRVYTALFGSVDTQIRRNAELVVDGGQLFSGISAAMLVTDPASEDAFRRQADKSDYSQVAFLAKQVSTSVASSPSSFMLLRKLDSSRAQRPLLGMAAPTALGQQRVGNNGKFRIGRCEIDPAGFSMMANRFDPIPAEEIGIVAQSLGLAGPPAIISGAAFSDDEIQRRGNRQSGDLKDYKVLHFATHGLTEGQFGCDDSPPGLLTSLGTSATSDLLLSYDEIANLRLDANLVVLSACRTASLASEEMQRRAGEAQPGGTLDGLVKAFFAAGSRAVMATYWSVSNEGQSEEFMAAFYSAAKDRSIVQALNQAQNTMLSNPQTSHPYFWGAYFAVGKTDNRVLADGQARVAAR